jgi:hypothetical protein
MALKHHMCHIINRTDEPITFVVNASIPGITIPGGSDTFERVPSISIGDKIAYAIEPQPRHIEINGDITRMEYR